MTPRACCCPRRPRRSRPASRTALSSAASTMAGRSPGRCSTSGCGCWRRLKAACCGCWTARMPTTCAGKPRRAASTRRGWSSRPSCRRTQHLARHQLADLFLDTLPYNAHTSCSDALWAGLPVVTCYGKAFPGRVAASLLKAIDLPELVTTTPADYEALALELAKNPGPARGDQSRNWCATAAPRRCMTASASARNIEGGVRDRCWPKVRFGPLLRDRSRKTSPDFPPGCGGAASRPAPIPPAGSAAPHHRASPPGSASWWRRDAASRCPRRSAPARLSDSRAPPRWRRHNRGGVPPPYR